ncbi:hypothetical protein [uncultured Tenacibaculum sp.]|uniref:coiled-coil domain-containing protein n=1 Tax=uncultured Tenacibaculum sp. TaxID=174713 RepID=UPI00263353ED|nr:hypothetical protein [uncultured Tenacibaculum sp.]
MKNNKIIKVELHESLTSMQSLSYSIISYGVFYGLKQAAFFYTLFAYLFTNVYVRLLASVFFGYFISRAMLNIAINISKSKDWVIISIAFFDFLVLCVITDILNQDNWKVTTNLLIFCAFVTYLGFWLNHVFVDKVKEKQNEKREKQNLANAKQILAEVKEGITDSNQKLDSVNQKITDSETKLTEVSSLITEKKQDLEKIEQEITDRTCPYCNSVFSNKKGRDSHKGRCPEKPQKEK